MLLPQALTGPMVWPQALCLCMHLPQVRRGPIVSPQVLGLHMLWPQVNAGPRRPNKTAGDSGSTGGGGWHLRAWGHVCVWHLTRYCGVTSPSAL
jgi:hypothetical protein